MRRCLTATPARDCSFAPTGAISRPSSTGPPAPAKRWSGSAERAEDLEAPGPGTYARLAQRFVDRGITSLRLDYRMPNDLMECVLDLVTGASYCKDMGHRPVVVVGHSFGGAVVIAAGAASDHVKGVVSLSPQTFGAGMVGMLAPRKLLVVHGKADTRLPYRCSEQIYDWAKEPKELVLYEGAEHRLEECRDELETLLESWIPQTLAKDIEVPEVKSSF